MLKEKFNTTHYEIFDYWKDKAITEDGCIINLKDCQDRFGEVLVVVMDWGEPECWCCGRWVELDKIENYHILLKEGNLKRIWNNKQTKSVLERCHIVPQMLGGEHNPSNLFLMCHICHERTPDYADGKYLLRYVYNARKHQDNFIQSKFSEILSAINMYGLTDKQMEYIANHAIDPDNLKRYEEKSGIHGASLKVSTFVASIIDYFQEDEKYLHIQ